MDPRSETSEVQLFYTVEFLQIYKMFDSNKKSQIKQ